MTRVSEKTLVLFGTYGEDNLGDDILLLSMIKGLRLGWPDCRLVVLTGDRLTTEALLRNERVSSERIFAVYSGRHGICEPRTRFPACLSWVLENVHWAARCDLMLIGPGNQLQDVTNPFRLAFFLSRAVLARVFRTPYAFVGIGFWDVRSWLSRGLLRFSARRAAFISTRDRGSARELMKMGIRPEKIAILADLGFAFDEFGGKPVEC
jgi:polysaccharide pyruvyl transferase WcaK-like protein